ncbi:MAG: hypothetical protein ACJ780_18470 [Solirubrobacteraceae bacterium]
MTGSLTIAWTAGAGRGCAAANLCGVSGSLEMLAGGSASASGGPAPFELSDFNAAVRVITRAADGSVRSTCADLLPVDITLTVRHTTRGLRAVLGRQFFQPPSAGRCAGPTSADLGSIRLPVHRFGAHSYDFSGTTGSAAGPFEITTSSTVRALVTFGNSIPIPPGSLFGSGESFSQSSPTPARPLPTRSVLQESARVSYRVRAARGSIVTSFFGLPSPRCEPLGACGDSGRLTQSLSGLGGVTFSGSRIVARRVSAAGALADLRSGRMRLSGGFGMSLMREAVTESLTQADGSTCADGASGGQVALVPGERGHHDNLEVESASIGGGPDPLRTRCPGPSATEVLEPHLGLFASAPVSPSEIGAHHLSLTASAGGLFTGLGWSGSRGGTITLTLTRVRERGGTQRVHQLVGRPGVTFP